ncbi:MAG: hypothetical protein PUG31_07145 [Eubacteriales bacterium]|jgi:formylmethanofuran dehydrogenase subunit E|nr:hypothetical protein [Clostridiales bacterium]MDD7397177.1 hypothetical protein [Eubacteriales bacterium]MDY2983339.1 hypothetical protein [Eubacteriales bacterium]
MSKISEKVAYLDGLMEGLDLEDVKLKKLFTAVIDALDEIAEEISDHEDAIAEIDESLDEVYDAMDDYDEILFGEDDEDEEEEDDDFFEVVCPNCGETVYFDEDMLDNPEGLLCPNCNETIDLSIAHKDEE